ncbi:hypothetical protein [Altererythrobacter xiamenensis]|uniref:hypothetical protein n=1 Tax=Altererythrobacter xiamenensis TaxID=1316679 RepID=UPI00135659BB|nr:hypothetical protein [Altererythrobacter xiamenensis]
MIVRASLIVSCLLTAACSDSDPMRKYELRDDRIADALSNNDEVSSLGNKAVWLVKTSSAAPNDRLSAFFGYMDNYEACLAVVELYSEKFPNDSYRCEVIA